MRPLHEFVPAAVPVVVRAVGSLVSFAAFLVASGAALASSHVATVGDNVSVADGARAGIANPGPPGGLLVGKRAHASAPGSSEEPDTSNYKAWLSLPFPDDGFVRDSLGIALGRTVSAVSLTLAVHPDFLAELSSSSAPAGSITLHLHGLLDRSRWIAPATDTWLTIEGNDPASAIGLDASRTARLASVALDGAALHAGRLVTFSGPDLTEFFNASLDHHFHTDKQRLTVPSGLVFMLVPGTRDSPPVLFEPEAVLAWELRHFNGQVGSGLEHDVFDPAFNRPPIFGGHPEIVAWATGVADLVRGHIKITDTNVTHGTGGEVSNRATFGRAEDALGPSSAADPDNPYEVVSLGDGGSITLTFPRPITDGPGWDFAVFENGFIDYTNHPAGDFMAWLELAHVEVSSDGVHFARFPSISLTRPYASGNYAGGDGFATTRASTIHNLAGKYILGYGTPFDLADLAGVDPLVDVARITHVRVVDVVGINRRSVVRRVRIGFDPVTGAPLHEDVSAADDPVARAFINRDSEGNEIVDPWPTPFWQGGFDLDAVGVRHQLPATPVWASWRAERFTAAQLEDAAVSGPAADPDGDGLPNLLEYALAGDPLVAERDAAPAVSLSTPPDSRLRIVFTRHRADLVYAVQGSSDLREWDDIAIDPGALGERVAVDDDAPPGSPRRFLRLKVIPRE